MTRRGPIRVLVFLLVTAMLLTTAAAGSPAEPQQPGDLEVKAAFVMNFVRLVEWSDIPGEVSAAELGICALSRSEFFNAVRSVAEDKKVGNRVVRVRVNANPDRTRCRVFIADAEDYVLARTVVRALADSPVLTVGNGPGFLEIGGMFELDLENRKVRFDAGLPAIKRAGLVVSARLLQLSRNLRVGGSGGN